MEYQKIFSDSTLKLKTKLMISSSICLFIGISKSLPTKLALIGLDLKNNENLIGWFLLVITFIIFINFVFMAYLDYSKFRNNDIFEKRNK